MVFLTVNPAYIHVPRSLTGAYVLSQPAVFDIAIPLLLLVLLLPKREWGPLTVRSAVAALGHAVGLLMFPLLAGAALFLYVQRWYVFFNPLPIGGLRWIQFVLGYLVLNRLIDEMPIANRWAWRCWRRWSSVRPGTSSFFWQRRHAAGVHRTGFSSAVPASPI